MKNKYFFLTVLGLVTALAVTGCNTSKEKKVEEAEKNVNRANQDLKEAQAEYDKEWKQFKIEAELEIDTNDKRIDEFKAKMKKSGKEIKAKYENEVAVLKQKNVELKKIISEYKYEGKDKWEEFKHGFEHDLDVIGKAVNELFTKK